MVLHMTRIMMSLVTLLHYFVILVSQYGFGFGVIPAFAQGTGKFHIRGLVNMTATVPLGYP